MENSEPTPTPSQTPFTLPPKQEPAPDAPTTLPPVSAKLPPSPRVPSKSATNPPIAKIIPNPKFVSPMPKIEETENEVPKYLPVISGVAAVTAITFSVLLYLKR